MSPNGIFSPLEVMPFLLVKWLMVSFRKQPEYDITWRCFRPVCPWGWKESGARNLKIISQFGGTTPCNNAAGQPMLVTCQTILRCATESSPCKRYLLKVQTTRGSDAVARSILQQGIFLNHSKDYPLFVHSRSIAICNKSRNQTDKIEHFPVRFHQFLRDRPGFFPAMILARTTLKRLQR